MLIMKNKKWSLYLGKISGARIYIHWTFSVLVLWILIDMASISELIMVNKAEQNLKRKISRQFELTRRPFTF